MKGKGKKERDSEDECPLLFIDFKSIDFKDCPRLSSILNRKDEKNIGLKDLDCLQLELESLLTSVISRKNQLENEMESLVNWHDAKTKDKKLNVKSEASGKRSNQMDASTSKKFKESHSTNHSAPHGSNNNSGKSQGSLRSKSKDVKTQDVPDSFNDPLAIASNSTPIRNDLPEKFWKFVEPYCAPVKPEDIKYLEEILKQCEVDDDLLKVPTIGKNNHTSCKLDDSWESKNDSSKSNTALEKKKGLSPYNSATPGEKCSKKNKDSRNDSDKCCFGILTQRLVSCLIEENLSRGEGLDTDLELNEKISNASNINLLKSLNFGNTNGLEKRLKKELEEQGLLDPEDGEIADGLDEESDEILAEMIKCQNELKIISAKNQATIKYLLEMAKKDVTKQEWETKLKAADTEVMEAYKKILSAKQKKRIPTKKEKEAATKALKDREAILKEIDSIK